MRTNKLKLYFAHPINTYDTDDEKKIILLLQSNVLLRGYEIENPNQACHQEGYQKLKESSGNGMQYFFDLVSECDGLVILPFADETIGAGVVGEAEQAFKEGKPVFLIITENFSVQQIYNLSGLKSLSIEETRARLRDSAGNLKTEYYKTLKSVEI